MSQVHARAQVSLTQLQAVDGHYVLLMVVTTVSCFAVIYFHVSITDEYISAQHANAKSSNSHVPSIPVLRCQDFHPEGAVSLLHPK